MDSMVTGRKDPKLQLPVLPPLAISIQHNSNQNAAKLFCDYKQKYILKLMWKPKRPKKASSLLKEQNTLGGSALSNFSIY